MKIHSREICGPFASVPLLAPVSLLQPMLLKAQTALNLVSPLSLSRRSLAPSNRSKSLLHRYHASSASIRRTMATASTSSESAKAVSNKIKFSAIQMKSGADKLANLENAYNLVRDAASQGATLITLPVRPLFKPCLSNALYSAAVCGGCRSAQQL